MMSAQPINDNQQHHIITDYFQTFERDTGLSMYSCDDIIEDQDSIFYTFSYLIQHLFSLIDSFLPCKSFTIKGLTDQQRRYLYVDLTEIDIDFTLNTYFDSNNNKLTDIQICTINLWSIPDYRTTPDLYIYQYWINVFNNFYSRIDNSSMSSNRNIIVSLKNYLMFKILYTDAISSYNFNFHNVNNIIHIPNQYTFELPPLNNYCHTCVSSNTLIKHQLADLIFDIKDKLTDSTYKEILENISLISP